MSSIGSLIISFRFIQTRVDRMNQQGMLIPQKSLRSPNPPPFLLPLILFTRTRHRAAIDAPFQFL